jgi:two-component system response regulator RpaA
MGNILVIDDDPDIGIMLKMILEYKGYTAEVTESGEKALELLGHRSYDLVIMDMLLSGVNGTDLCQRIRREPHLDHIPVMMISAHPNAKELCLKAGADDFILKPFDMNEILLKLRGLLQKVN